MAILLPVSSRRLFTRRSNATDWRDITDPNLYAPAMAQCENRPVAL